MSTPRSTPVDAPTSALGRRELLDEDAAESLSGLYKALANPHRLRLLHAIERAGELSVGQIADEVGMSMQAVSNQLQRLTDQRILVARREGNRSYYRIIDPCVPGLVELGICLVEENQER